MALGQALLLSACASTPEPDPLVEQMRSGGACAPIAPPPLPPGAASGILPPAGSPATPSRARPRIDLQGQMSIKLSAFGEQAAQGLSLGFFFAGNTDAGQLDLMTLMGSQVAQVNWQADEAWLTNDKGRRRYNNLDELSQAALGEVLPLRQLIHWLQGQPEPEQPSQPGPQADTFIQQGWLIDAHELAEKKLHARRDATASQRGVQIKVYLDR